MSYNEGFKDAVDLFERAVNRNIRKGNGSRKELVATLDNMIATVYIAKLALADKDECEFEDLLNKSESGLSDEMNKKIDDLLSQIFKGSAPKKEEK